MFNLKNQLGKHVIGTVLALATGTIVPSIASAGDRGPDRYDNGGQHGYDHGPVNRPDFDHHDWDHDRDHGGFFIGFGMPAPAYETRTTRVWVEPIYRTVCDRVWVPPVTQDVCDRVWVEPTYEVRHVVRYEGRRRIVSDERCEVTPGHFEDRHRTVVIADGHWDNVDRQEVVSPGHFEDRVERIRVAQANPGFDLRFDYHGH